MKVPAAAVAGSVVRLFEFLLGLRAVCVGTVRAWWSVVRWFDSGGAHVSFTGAGPFPALPIGVFVMVVVQAWPVPYVLEAFDDVQAADGLAAERGDARAAWRVQWRAHRFEFHGLSHRAHLYWCRSWQDGYDCMHFEGDDEGDPLRCWSDTPEPGRVLQLAAWRAHERVCPDVAGGDECNCLNLA